jgi:hypothetical protein
MALVAIALIGLLALGIFRLDVMLGAPQRRSVKARHKAGTDDNGIPLYSDPDGRPWDKSDMRK